MDSSSFFRSLAILMTVAGFVSAVFSRFKWPKVIGYILAGVLMSGNVWGCQVIDSDSVQTIGQLGVVFLMFAMGLDFSLKDMQRLKSVTFPVAAFDTIMMTWLGYTVGTKVLGWNPLPSLFLGAAICDSATTMLAKVIDEMKWSSNAFVKYALGTSVCEDIVCVGIIAVISGVAGGKGMDLVSAGYSMGGLLVFFLAVIGFGFVLVPRLLVSVARRKDDEVLILTILGCLFFVSYVADYYKFSLALGAFLVGILGAASDVRKRVADLVSPLRSMFAAVFFVSIGLLVDPAQCCNEKNLVAILVISLAVVVGKFLNCSLGALLCGERVKTAVQMGMSLAQIGEFAFMVALLYANSTGDRNSPMYQVVVAVSILTTLLNPFLIRYSEPVGEWMEKKVPARLASVLEAYRGFVEKYRSGNDAVEIRQEVKRTLMRLGLLAASLFAVSTVCGALPELRYFKSVEGQFGRYFFLLANVFTLAFLPMVIHYARTLGEDVSVVLVSREDQRWQQSLRMLIAQVVVIAVVAGYFTEAIMINLSLMPHGDCWDWTLVIAVLVLVGCLGWKFFSRAGHRAAERFREALTAEERREKLAEVISFSIPDESVHHLVLDLASPAIGGTVVSLNIRAKTGASVISVERNGETIRNVDPSLEFRPGDVLVVLGDSAQIAALKDLLGIIV